MEHSILILNLRQVLFCGLPFQVKIDRTSIYGNPYIMPKLILNPDAMRDEVCDRYESYFYAKLKSDTTFLAAVNHLVDITREYGKIELYCWCAPKRCHGETIKKYILDNL